MAPPAVSSKANRFLDTRLLANWNVTRKHFSFVYFANTSPFSPATCVLVIAKFKFDYDFVMVAVDSPARPTGRSRPFHHCDMRSFGWNRVRCAPQASEF